MCRGGINDSESHGACLRGEKEPVDPAGGGGGNKQNEAADSVASWRTKQHTVSSCITTTPSYTAL